MTKTTHGGGFTPGPLKAQPETHDLRNPGWVVVQDRARGAIQTASLCSEEDARLYAEAPDLLEVAREGLIAAEAAVEERRGRLEERGDYEPEDTYLAKLVARRDRILACISKATGGE